MKHNYYFLLMAVFSLLCVEGFAQVQTRKTTPKTFTSIVGHNEIDETNIISLPTLDMDKIRVEDAEDAKKGDFTRFGRAVPLFVGLEAGKWHLDISRGGYRWSLGITAKQAKGLLINFDDFSLPKGAELYAFDAKKTVVFGPVTAENSSLKGRFATDLISGDTIFLELFEPVQVRGQSKLKIISILHAYNTTWQDQADDSPGFLLADCQRDVVCQEGNAVGTEMDAVAFIFDTQTSSACSGTLLNNACNNLRPTLLTAKHCLGGGGSNPANWSFRFRFRNSTCGGANTTSYVSILGATEAVRSPNTGAATTDVSTDALLLQLSVRPSAQSGITYAGWSRNPNVSAVTALHHPRKHPMKVSTAPAPTDVTDLLISTSTTSSGTRTLTRAWRADWNPNMTAQPGSSGCAFFNQDRRLVGQLSSGGPEDCATRQAWAGRFDIYWDEGFNVHLSDDPSVMQTNTVGIPSFTLPDVICGFVPLGINWNGIINMNFTSGTLVGVQGSNQGFGLEPIPGFSGAGFAEIQLKPSGITCNTPLIIRKDFQVGLPNPTVTIHNWGGCETWLAANGSPSDSYLWIVHMSNNTVRYFIDQYVMIHNYNSGESFGYELTVTNQCGSKTVYGNGLLVGEGCTANLTGKDADISALKAQSFKPTLSISPNPAAQEVTLNIKDVSPMLLNTLCDVTILNQVGQAVFSQKLILENAIRLDINSLANGFYVVQVKGENGLSLSQKLIVNKK